MKTSQKLAALAEQELPKLLNHVIVADGEKYRVFGSYVMRQTTQGYALTYQDTPVGTFTSTRSAVAWCIADKNRQYNLANEIQHLDFALLRLRNDIEVRSGQARKSYGNFWETVTAKAQHKQSQSQQIENELTKCINSANTPYKTNR